MALARKALGAASMALVVVLAACSGSSSSSSAPTTTTSTTTPLQRDAHALDTACARLGGVLGDLGDLHLPNGLGDVGRTIDSNLSAVDHALGVASGSSTSSTAGTTRFTDLAHDLRATTDALRSAWDHLRNGAVSAAQDSLDAARTAYRKARVEARDLDLPRCASTSSSTSTSLAPTTALPTTTATTTG